MTRALQDADILPFRDKTEQDKVTKIFKGEASGYESYSLLTFDKFCALEIVDISRKDIEREKKQK